MAIGDVVLAGQGQASEVRYLNRFADTHEAGDEIVHLE